MASTAKEQKAEEKRAGAALVRASKPYSEEISATTWRLFGSTMAVWLLAEAIALLLGEWATLLALPLWPVMLVQLAAALVAGGTWVRIFIFYHDYLHGAVFRESKLGQALMVAVGWALMTPPPVWKQTHDYHHQNNAKMLGASIGSYPIVSTGIWRSMNPTQRRWYAFARHPLTMIFGYFTVFMGGMCVAACVRDPKVHWQGPAAMVVHFVLLGLVGTTLGWFAAFAGVFLPVFLACAGGSYLFYAQHNYPSVELRGRREWTYHFAALKSSSMFDMPAFMHWFTGNIGYHHVHHLNHKIPFYRLPEAMSQLEALQSPGRTTWSPSDIRECLRLKLWDPERGRMISWAELEEPVQVAAK